MGASKYLLLVLYALISNLLFPVPVTGIESYTYLFDYRAPRLLNFSAGDVLTCIINSRFIAELVGAEHSMLALNSSHIAHINADSGTEGTLQSDNFADATRDSGYRRCRVATNHYDRAMLELGVSPKRDRVAVADAAAASATGRSVYYDLMGCNCQHWVTEWKYGKAWSVQSNQPPDVRCELRDRFTTGGGSVSATTYNRNGQRSAQASAAWGDVKVGVGAFNAQLKGPSIGAAAENGVQNTGLGLDAGLFEVGGNVGKWGVTLGLKADTKIGYGADGATLMVLGTGVSFSRSKPCKICLLGSCINFG